MLKRDDGYQFSSCSFPFINLTFLFHASVHISISKFPFHRQITIIWKFNDVISMSFFFFFFFCIRYTCDIHTQTQFHIPRWYCAFSFDILNGFNFNYFKINTFEVYRKYSGFVLWFLNVVNHKPKKICWYTISTDINIETLILMSKKKRKNNNNKWMELCVCVMNKSQWIIEMLH